MNISIKRTGGFAGLTEDLGNIDTTQVDKVIANEIEQMIILYFTVKDVG